MQCAVRKNKKGKAIGGMVMGIRKELMEKNRRIVTEKEGMIVGSAKIGKQRWRIVEMNIKGNMEEMLQGLEEWMEEMGREVCTLIGGDFNARTGTERRG